MHHFLLKPLTHDPSRQPAIMTGRHDERCLVAVSRRLSRDCRHHTTTTGPPQPFYGPFSRTTRWASARRELLDNVMDFMVQGEIKRGRHTDHPAGRHSIRTNQCQPPPFSLSLNRCLLLIQWWFTDLTDMHAVWVKACCVFTAANSDGTSHDPVHTERWAE